jgi:LysM repeat protein
VRALRPGTELVIPDRGRPSGSGRSLASVRERVPKGHRAVTHVVQKGETLYEISRRYAVRVDEIRRWNSIERVKNLRPGRRIKLYVKNDQPDRI